MDPGQGLRESEVRVSGLAERVAEGSGGHGLSLWLDPGSQVSPPGLQAVPGSPRGRGDSVV